MKNPYKRQIQSGIEPVFGRGRPGIFALAFFLTALIFLLLPFTQYLGNAGEKKYIVRDIAMMPPPPPKAPPAPPQESPPPPQTEPTPPAGDAGAPRLSLAQMDMTIASGMGDAMAGSLSGGFGPGEGGGAADLALFEIGELDRVPRLLRGAKPVYPWKMLRDRVPGIVRLRVMIDTEGRVSVREVIEATNSEFEEAAVEAASKLVYEVPTRDGKPVNTQFVMPMSFSPE